MAAPSERAAAETAELTPLIGHWDVDFSVFESDSLVHQARGRAEVQFMNRGHALIERFECEDFDGQGHDLSTISFMMHTPSTGKWSWGIADSYKENIRTFDGERDGGTWNFQTILRARGGQNLVHHRLRLQRIDDDTFELQASQGVYGEELSRIWTRQYQRRAGSDSAIEFREDYGEAKPGLVKEAHEFDFLIGEWDATHQLTLPTGQEVQFPSNASAVYVLNGHAILEHNWNDVDPKVPDAATTIVRIYNRAMRRWESMYSTNRFNSILYFGGVREGAQIVLHPFEADNSETPISYWTFHDIGEKRYGWYANTSRDRGETFQKTWIIDATRRR